MSNCAGFTARLSDFEALAPELSVACTVKFAGPAAVGIPEIVPFAASDSPAGSEPLVTDHEYVPVPPLAAKACEYAAPTVAAGREAVVMTNCAGLTVRVSGLVAFAPELSVACTVKFAGPAAVGVPEIVPFAASDSPTGSEPPVIDHE